MKIGWLAWDELGNIDDIEFVVVVVVGGGCGWWCKVICYVKLSWGWVGVLTIS